RLEVVVDADEVLADDPAGAQVGVADLRVPHLPFGQPDRTAGGGQLRVRVARPQVVEHRRRGKFDGVSRPRRRHPPAAEDEEADERLVQPAAAARAAGSAGSRLAPPIRPPSMSGWAKSSAALPGLTLPPYWIRTRSPTPCRPSTRPRMNAWAACAISGVAVSPVPIAQTGSAAGVRRPTR